MQFYLLVLDHDLLDDAAQSVLPFRVGTGRPVIAEALGTGQDDLSLIKAQSEAFQGSEFVGFRIG